MKFDPIFIDTLINTTAEPIHPYPTIRMLPGAKIFKSTMLGPLYLSRNSHLGADVTIGKYSGLNENTIIARATVGAFCAFGARTAINPFNHPTDWLSTHEFQYHPNSYDWVEEYKSFRREPRAPEMYLTATIGNDVWMGHNVNVLSGVNVGDGAVVAAGSIVTKDVPPYAVVAGVPATIKRLRFPDNVVARLLRAKWWELELSDLSGLPFRDIERCLDAIEELREKVRRNARVEAP
jgi:acetyltransferase-like isoleucine patch superfamily enzyme